MNITLTYPRMRDKDSYWVDILADGVPMPRDNYYLKDRTYHLQRSIEVASSEAEFIKLLGGDNEPSEVSATALDEYERELQGGD